VVNIVLDMLFISSFHVGSYTPTVFAQASIRFACDLAAALAGLGYFAYIMRKTHRLKGNSEGKTMPTLAALVELARPAGYTFTESAIRNAFYLWVVSQIISLGQNYATAWGVFNTIRWGLIMVPVLALEASTLAFVGHRWGRWEDEVVAGTRNLETTWKDIKCKFPQAVSRDLAADTFQGLRNLR